MRLNSPPAQIGRRKFSDLEFRSWRDFSNRKRSKPGAPYDLSQVRELTKAVEKARASLAEITKGVGTGTGLAAAIGETDKLAASWKNVARQAGEARAVMMGAAGSVRPPTAAGGGGGGGRHQPRWLGGGGGAHFGGPTMPVPGGGHVNFRGGAAAAAGLLGYGAYEAAQMEDAIFQLNYHSGQEQNASNSARFRKVLQDAMATSGFGLRDIAAAAKQEIRMFQGTPGGGLDVLPEMLRASTIESRLKGESPEESMKALIGLAHMTKQYSPEQIKKLAPAFAFLSTANPGSLSSIERAAGYAVPLLQSGLEIDPTQTLLLGTALTRAGATNTKSGTWLREMALRAMPGTSLMSRIAYKRHEEALRAMGLVDDHDKPTWFSNGKPDLPKMLDIAGQHAAAIPLEKRASYERQLFGAQGGGAFALLSDSAVMGQVRALRGQMDSPEFKARYGGFMAEYNSSVTAQNARTTMQTFNNLAMDIGQKVLPGLNTALGDFKAILEGIRGLLPNVPKAGATVGARAIEGALVGGGVGFFAGGVGAPLGAAIGGVLGTAEGFMESYAGGQAPGRDRWAKENAGLSKAIADAIRGTPGGPGGVFPGGTSRTQLAPITLNLNLDGRTLASSIGEYLIEAMKFSTVAPEAGGMSIYNSGGE